MLNDLSVIMDLSMISVNVPGLAQMIQSIILNFIYLDILQTSMWLSPFLSVQDMDSEGVIQSDFSINDYFDQSGFNSMVMVKNLGSSLIYLAVYFVALVIYMFLYMFRTFFEK